tara:strand:- start:582 stop:1151 length:570 start_codon:yes stop_codon:yes gene_type:complete
MIIVCSLSDLKNVCESVKPSHLVSVIDPGFEPKTPKGINHHLKLGFDDIVSINDNGPLYRLPGQDNTKEQILFDENKCLSVVNFLKTWKLDKPIVIHCWCGVSRSMATATYLMCSLDIFNIDRNIRYIRNLAPHANPNKLMLSYFEKKLGTNNQISLAFEKYPNSISYDCEYNFAPVTIFDIKDMKEFV